MFELVSHNLRDLYLHRGLVSTLVSKELKSRYRGSVLGVLWTFLNPLLLMGVYALVFSVYMRMDIPNYAVFMFAGLLPWIWFSSSLMEGIRSIVEAGSLITKSLFPAQVLPTVRILANAANYLLSLPMLFLFIAYYGIPVGISLLALPVIAAVQFAFTLGLVYAFSALNVQFRDIQHILGNFVVLWFFLCPIIYSADSIPPAFRFTLYLNPMSVLIMSYQDIFIYNRFPSWPALGVVGLLSIALLVIGIAVFERRKEYFAEQI